MPSITPAQIRGARGMLDWSKVDLAKAARLSISSVLSAEGRNPGRASPKTMTVMREALEAAGVEFSLADNGVRLRPDLAQPPVFARFM